MCGASYNCSCIHYLHYQLPRRHYKSYSLNTLNNDFPSDNEDHDDKASNSLSPNLSHTPVKDAKCYLKEIIYKIS